LKLWEWGEREAQAMRAILEQQRKRISSTAAEHQDRSPGLFDQEEMRQLEADRRHWARRLTDLEQELRITVASTDAPFYEPNPNTGEPLTIEPPPKTVVARNAVHHDRTHASRVLAPLRTSGLPAGGDR
jgi:predicted acyl esterase